MRLFDPRANGLIDTENPAIILADAMIKVSAINPDKKFWDAITTLANYADSNEPKKTKQPKKIKQPKKKSLNERLNEIKKKNMVRSRVPQNKAT